MITDGMRGAIVSTKEDRSDRQRRLVQYIIETLHMHNMYAAGYFFCEFLNFVNVVSTEWARENLRNKPFSVTTRHYLKANNFSYEDFIVRRGSQWRPNHRHTGRTLLQKSKQTHVIKIRGFDVWCSARPNAMVQCQAKGDG